MSELSCSCAGESERRATGDTDGRVEEDTVTVADAREASRSRPIPDALGGRLRTAHELDDTPATIGDWMDGIRDTMAERGEARPEGEPPNERAAEGREQLDGPPAVADLCVAGAARHRAAWDGSTEQFHCTIDALMVPFITDEPVTVTSASPRDGTLVTVEVDGDQVVVTPGDAVLSLGAAAVEDGDGFDRDAAIQGLCAYGNAFPSREDYETWAADVDAETTAIPLTEGVGLAADIVGE
jgi:hypothetical protein